MKQVKCFTLLLMGFISLNVLAVPPHLPDLVRGGNRWMITAYYDDSPVHTRAGTQGICFYYAGTVGTHQRYLWISDTFPDWNGRATQEGDQVFMHGDYAKEVGHDSMEWELTTNSLGQPNQFIDRGMGHWREWREDPRYGITIGWGNTELKRAGHCRYKSTGVIGIDIDGDGDLEISPDEQEVADITLEENRNIEPPKDENGNIMTEPLGNLEKE